MISTRRLIFGGILLAALAMPLVSPAQNQGITITVFPALAPNRWGSPSWNAWASNAVTAILNGYSSYGDPSSPTFYQQITNAVPVTNNMVTSFPSWMGSG